MMAKGKRDDIDEDGRPIPVFVPQQIQQVDLRSQPVAEVQGELERLWDAVHALEETVEKLKNVNAISAN
jgi:cell division protein FtsB